MHFTSALLGEPGSGRTPLRAEQVPRQANRRPPQLLMPVLLLALAAGATATKLWAGTRSRPTVNATSSAAGDDGFAKYATQTEALSVAKVVRG